MINQLFTYIVLDHRLIFRNNNIRLLYITSIIISTLGIFCNVIIGLKEKESVLLIFTIIFSLGYLFSFNFGRYAISWYSQSFDGLLTQNVNIRTFVKAKLIVLNFTNFIFFIINLIFILIFDLDILYLILNIFIYLVGFGNFYLVFLSNYNISRIEINSKIYEIYNQRQLPIPSLVSMFLIAYPLIIFYVFSNMANSKIIISCLISIPGIISIAFYKFWIRKIYSTFLKKKYIIAEVFKIK